ncbi:MAG: DUF2332 domain-containing protein [Micromonosporaceae bacterium]|nr:DUF2332 domain-containing protein [Micromonosporaceae bacterium]
MTATADWYREFGRRETRGLSPAYERLSQAVAEDGELLALLDTLPEPKRQPNLLFAAARYLGGPVESWHAFRDWVSRHWAELSTVMRERRTQTNEPGRCATLLPVLALLPQPLALLEVGASAGLCLYPDAYHYRYGSHHVGATSSPVRIDCTVRGAVPLPDRMPTVVWRAGIDLNPLDVRDDEDLRWLDCLIWPEQQHRRERLRAAAGIVRADPPHLVRGDLVTDLPALAAQAPAGATLVVFHTSVLAYVPPDGRRAFTEVVRSLPARWISNEAPGVVPGIVEPTTPTSERLTTRLALDGQVLGCAAPHGQSLEWW